jgi:hypothetical protein
MPRLYYDIKTFPAQACLPPRSSRGPSGSGPASSGPTKAEFFASVDSPAVSRRGSNELGLKEPAMRGEISGCALDGTGGDHVKYMSPFTLRTRLERLLLEHGEECLTREWCRAHHPDIYWNLVWFCTRLSVPFPLVLESVEALGGEPTSVAAEGGLSSPGSTSRSRGSGISISRRESSERGGSFFREIVVVGWEGLVVRTRCERVEAALKARVLTPRVSVRQPPQRSGSAGAETSLAAQVVDKVEPPPGPLPAEWVEALGPLPLEALFPNVSAKELEVLTKVRDLVVAKGPAGLKEAMVKFLGARAALQGWTSESTMGSMYRVFLKVAANYRVKKLHNSVPVGNLNANPALEHEYTTAVMRVGERVLRDQGGKGEKDTLAELPRRDAIKFRSVFGHLYA